MGKLSKLFDVVKAIIKKPYLLNSVIQTDDYWQAKINEDFPAFTEGLPQIALNDLLTDRGRELAPISFLGGGSMVTDIALLKSLADTIPHCNYFEIGTWRGESVSNIAAVAEHCTTLNLSAEEMNSLGWPNEYAELHGYFSKNLSNVSHVYGDSKVFNFQGLQKKYDLIFIDGDHSHNFVINDSQKIWDNLMHPQSVVVWHDYAHSPEKLRAEVLHGILTAVPFNQHHRLYHVSNTLCAVYLPDTWIANSTKPSQKLVKPEVHFTVKIN
ncbi:MAG: hypothetical protein RLZZ252_472 [Bacteroidota bacterium]|jgi:predicted O-methyltransferase YrrM